MGAIELECLEFVKDKINVVELSEEERAEWRKATEPVVERFEARAGELGKTVVLEAKQL